MLQDEDEGTADAVKAKLDAYPEVHTHTHCRATIRHCHAAMHQYRVLCATAGGQLYAVTLLCALSLAHVAYRSSALCVLCSVCSFATQWAEYRDMKHDLFVPQGGEVLLLESGASAETLLLEM